ncbi:hypothetical protein CONLIGDRAFT_367357 [Coniochaeta ligniaria NRRL 30616]|uniref:Uncharacterized protein n=1 Tax=Coniochaeta ligniaria NRRL 30616 TaxID=1408157 RepID=A0A1J7JKL8_9PEZI|nr:hypothetical protein CONLIGDRAFT_367357 [Coniochaeta ligniaria NRRL 30616]
MSHLFPQAAYAEDQPYAHTILAWHVLSRGFAIGAGVGSTIHLIRQVARPSPSLSILRSSGNGALIGTGLLALALVGRMRGRDEIEWKDRSYRLLWNRGQREADDWLLVGAVLEGVGVLASRELRVLGVRGVLGGMGLGSLVGMLGQSAWRYGVKGGFEEEKLV